MEDKMPYFEVHCAFYFASLSYCSSVTVNTFLLAKRKFFVGFFFVLFLFNCMCVFRLT